MLLFLSPKMHYWYVEIDVRWYCMQIPIFEKGYEKDPAVVAREAIQEASRNKSDVVLVDTAGRMQVSTRWFCFKYLSVLVVLECSLCFQDKLP